MGSFVSIGAWYSIPGFQNDFARLIKPLINIPKIILFEYRKRNQYRGIETHNFVFCQSYFRAIREYYEKTGFVVGFKPAGGIRTAKDACTWLILIKEELGDGWLSNKLFRIGASGLLIDIERQLFHYVTGRYAAAHELAMS